MRKVLNIRMLGIAGMVGAASLLLTLAAMYVLRPDFSYLTSFVSEYANGPYGALFNAALLLHGAGNAAIAVGLALALPSRRSARWGVLLFGLAATSVIFVGIFSTDPPNAPQTVYGTVHVWAAFASIPIEVAALLLLARAFGETPDWRFFVGVTKAAAAIGAVSFAVLLFLIKARVAPGLTELGVSAPLFLWEFTAGALLTRTVVPIGPDQRSF